MSEAVEITARSLIDLRSAGESLCTALPARILAAQTGNYRSPFKGRGMEFEESRQYQVGDDIRTMDWRVTARTGQAHTKVYRDERERPVFLCLDFRRAMFFATRGAFKTVIAARIAALLAWRHNGLGDRVGALLFSENQHKELKPRRGTSAVLTLIRELCTFSQRTHEPTNGESDLELAAARLRRLAHPGSLVFVVSDFRGLSDTAKSLFAQIARHCSLTFILVYDPLEASLPPPGRYTLRDGSKSLLIDTTSVEQRKAYQNRFDQHVENIKTYCQRFRIVFTVCDTQADLVKLLQVRLGT